MGLVCVCVCGGRGGGGKLVPQFLAHEVLFHLLDKRLVGMLHLRVNARVNATTGRGEGGEGVCVCVCV